MKFEKDTGIVAHGDGDGLISAAVLHRLGCDGELTLTQPFLLEKLADLKGPTVVVDLTVNNRGPEATIEWVRRNEAQIVLWVDHHPGTEALADILGDRLVHDPDQPSCPALMASAGMDVPEDWVVAANASDRPADFEPTPLSQRINAAFKVALVDLQDGDRSAVDRVQKACVEELMSGVANPLVEEKAAAYGALLEATNVAAEAITEAVPGIFAVTLGADKIDKTALFMKGYEKGQVVVLQFTSLETGEAVTTVATNRRGLNLVEAFGFTSGAPFRVTLGPDKAVSHAAQLQLVVDTLKEEVSE